jgi:hypothetical protein
LYHSWSCRWFYQQILQRTIQAALCLAKSFASCLAVKPRAQILNPCGMWITADDSEIHLIEQLS